MQSQVVTKRVPVASVLTTMMVFASAYAHIRTPAIFAVARAQAQSAPTQPQPAQPTQPTNSGAGVSATSSSVKTRPLSAQPENIHAAMFPLWFDGFPKSQNPAHLNTAQRKVYEWFVKQGISVIPQDEVRRKLHLDQATPVDPEFSTCRSKECASKMARTLDKDFVIQVSISSLPEGKLVKPVDVTVTLVFADPALDVVSSFSKVTMYNVEAATEATCLQVWQIYQDRVRQHGGSVKPTASNVQPIDKYQQAPPNAVTSSADEKAPKRSSSTS